MSKENINIEDMDIEAQIKDLEDLLESLKGIVDDIGFTVKATMSASLKNIGSYSILLKRNQNRLKELLTRYEFDKIKHIPVGTLLGVFMKKLFLGLVLTGFILADETYITEVNGKTVFVSKRIYNGAEVIVIENNVTYVPYSMIEKSKD